MHIFVSWSGERSKTAALGLKSLLEDVFQEYVKVFISDHINPGESWAQRLRGELEQSHFGILCLTQENFQAPWLLFEAGAITKKLDSSRVAPYLIDELPPAIDRSPLAQFQQARADREGTYRLVKSINEIRDAPKQNDKLERSFARWWPDFEKTLTGLRVPDQTQPAQRSDRELLEAIVQRLDSLAQPRSGSAVASTELSGAAILHLMNLRDDPTKIYDRRDMLQKELRHLRDLGLIKNRLPIAALPDKFQLNQWFDLTDAGVEYLNNRGNLLQNSQRL